MLSLLVLASAACPARAEDATDYPSKKIKMLLPFGAGGGGDEARKIRPVYLPTRFILRHSGAKPRAP
jgi:tripartite-type tricarboxylate transporter receptor subunit TctC